MQSRQNVARMASLVAGVLVGTVAASVALADDTAAAYKKQCASCHGDTGKGDGAAGKFLKPPPGDFSVVLKDKSTADIAKVIKEGGKAVGMAASMPAFGGKLNDEQINALAEHIKSFAGN